MYICYVQIFIPFRDKKKENVSISFASREVANKRVKSISKDVFMVFYMIDFISVC